MDARMTKRPNFSDKCKALVALKALRGHLVSRSYPCRITGKPALACFHEFLRPFAIDTLGNAFATAQLRNDFLTPQSVQHNTDLFLCLILFAN
jgi:hypothetical protein